MLLWDVIEITTKFNIDAKIKIVNKVGGLRKFSFREANSNWKENIFSNSDPVAITSQITNFPKHFRKEIIIFQNIGKHPDQEQTLNERFEVGSKIFNFKQINYRSFIFCGSFIFYGPSIFSWKVVHFKKINLYIEKTFNKVNKNGKKHLKTELQRIPCVSKEKIVLKQRIKWVLHSQKSKIILKKELLFRQRSSESYRYFWEL